MNGISVKFCIQQCILYSTDNERYVDGDKWVATTFAPTPIMSTYLLAFTVNTFLSESDKHDDKEISVCCCFIVFLLFFLL